MLLQPCRSLHPFEFQRSLNRRFQGIYPLGSIHRCFIGIPSILNHLFVMKKVLMRIHSNIHALRLITERI